MNLLNSLRFYRWIVLLDGLGLFGAFALASYLRFGNFDYLTQDTFILVVAAVIFSVFFILDLYSPESQINGLRTPPRTIVGVFIAGLVVVLFNYLSGPVNADSKLLGRGVFAIAMGGFAIFSSYVRFYFTHRIRRIRSAQNFLLVAQDPDQNRFIDEFNKKNMGQLTHVILDGATNNTSQLHSLLLKDWDAVIIQEGLQFGAEELKIIMERRLNGVRVFDIADFYELFWFKVPIFFLKDQWFAFSHGFRLIHNPVGLRVKRLLDIFMSLILLVVLSPILALVWLGVFLSSPGPGLFRQVRIGEKGRLFTIYKFRTMRNDAEKDGAKWASENDSRITKLGHFLRKLRFDELPQLYNVFKGDMSFIGPRPEVPHFTEQLSSEIPYYNLRHLMKPGITGWAQVMYRYGASVSDSIEKLQYELYYLKNYSLTLDVAIVFKTLRVILSGSGR